ncbi:TPA: hypothetical protein TZ303_001415 [Streptococcus suis]|nr:hypothetical protein [Streptococcus suis]
MTKFGIQTVQLPGPSKYIYVLCLDDDDNYRIREIERSWLQDLLNPLVNFDKKLMSQTDVITKDFGRQIVADTFKL